MAERFSYEIEKRKNLLTLRLTPSSSVELESLLEGVEGTSYQDDGHRVFEFYAPELKRDEFLDYISSIKVNGKPLKIEVEELKPKRRVEEYINYEPYKVRRDSGVIIIKGEENEEFRLNTQGKDGVPYSVLINYGLAEGLGPATIVNKCGYPEPTVKYATRGIYNKVLKDRFSGGEIKKMLQRGVDAWSGGKIDLREHLEKKLGCTIEEARVLPKRERLSKVKPKPLLAYFEAYRVDRQTGAIMIRNDKNKEFRLYTRHGDGISKSALIVYGLAEGIGAPALTKKAGLDYDNVWSAKTRLYDKILKPTFSDEKIKKMIQRSVDIWSGGKINLKEFLEEKFGCTIEEARAQWGRKRGRLPKKQFVPEKIVLKSGKEVTVVGKRLKLGERSINIRESPTDIVKDFYLISSGTTEKDIIKTAPPDHRVNLRKIFRYGYSAADVKEALEKVYLELYNFDLGGFFREILGEKVDGVASENYISDFLAEGRGIGRPTITAKLDEDTRRVYRKMQLHYDKTIKDDSWKKFGLSEMEFKKAIENLKELGAIRKTNSGNYRLKALIFAPGEEKRMASLTLTSEVGRLPRLQMAEEAEKISTVLEYYDILNTIIKEPGKPTKQIGDAVSPPICEEDIKKTLDEMQQKGIITIKEEKGQELKIINPEWKNIYAAVCEKTRNGVSLTEMSKMLEEFENGAKPDDLNEKLRKLGF